MSKIKHFLQQSWVLIISSFFFGLLIAIANAAWSPKIEQNKIEKINRLMKALLPEAKKLNLVTELKIELTKSKKTKLLQYLSRLIGTLRVPYGPDRRLFLLPFLRVTLVSAKTILTCLQRLLSHPGEAERLVVKSL